MSKEITSSDVDEMLIKIITSKDQSTLLTYCEDAEVNVRKKK
jgi:hypothetical protein